MTDAMSLLGTKRTSRDVRSLVAIGGRADMAGEARFGQRLTPIADFAPVEASLFMRASPLGE